MDTTEYIAFTATMLAEFDDAGFIETLLDILKQRHNRANPQIVFHPAVLERLRQLKQTTPTLFYGAFTMALQRRKDRLLPTLHQAMSGQGVPNGGAARQPKVIAMDAVEAEALEWLWWPYIARGTVTLLDGDPGIGKSLLTLYLGAIISRGHPLPDQQGRPTLPTASGTVLLLSAEDSVTHTIKQRLSAADADQSRIKVFNTLLDEHNEEQVLTLEAANHSLLAQVLERHHPTLVIVDPLQAFLGQMDMHRANETRPFMRGLQHLAEAYDTSIVCVRHPTKPGQTIGKAMHRGMGSVDFIGAARSGLFVEQHPVDRDKAMLCQFKNNLAPLGRTQIFSKKDGRFAWDGITRLSAEQIAGSGRGPFPYAFLAACFWLEAQFVPSTMQAAKDLEERAQEDDILWRRVKEAKEALGIRSQKIGHGNWCWILPPLTSISHEHTYMDTYHSSTTYPSSTTCHSIDNTYTYNEKAGIAREQAEEVEEFEEGQEGQVSRARAGGATSLPCLHTWLVVEGRRKCALCSQVDDLE